jgi:CBS domain-containing protein
MTTVFGTPIAAIMLAVELLLFEWTPRSFIPVAVAAIIAEVERTALHIPSPLFPIHGEMAVSLTALVAWIGIGIAGGLLSALLTQLVYACEDGFLKLPIHWMWWPAIGGVVIGIGGLIEPHALGVGYDNIGRMLEGHGIASVAIVLLVVKAIIWAVALGSGTSGGILAPLLIMGGAMGVVLSGIGILPAAPAGFWALIAMAATMGGTMRSPLTATFFAAELTGNTHVLLPLIAACSSAHIVSVLLMKRSILTEKIARRGYHIVREYRVDPFALARVMDVMTPNVETVPASMTLHDAIRFLTDAERKHPSFPVLDAERKVIGIIDPPTLLKWRRDGKHRHTTLAELVQGTTIPIAYPDEYLDSVVDRLLQANAAHLVVVSRQDNTLAGYVGWRDLMSAKIKLRQEENDRASFLHRKNGG